MLTNAHPPHGIDDPEARRTLKRHIAAAHATVLHSGMFALAALYAVLAVAHLFMVDGPARPWMTATAALTCATCGVLGARWQRRPVARPTRTIGWLALLLLANVVLHMALVPEARHSSNFAALQFGYGMVILSRRWFAMLTAALLTSWSALVAVHAIPGTSQWAWFLLLTALVSVLGHLQRRGALLASAARERVLERHARALNELVRDPDVVAADVAAAALRICRTALDTLAVERVSIWEFDADDQQLRCIAVALAGTGTPTPAAADVGQVILRAEAPDYFAALHTHRTVVIDDVASDPRTTTFPRTYFERTGVVGMLDAPILTGGRAVGVICHERTRHHPPFTNDEQTFAASMADIAAGAWMARERARLDAGRRDLERRQQVSERLERLGVLAGGVAHDLNNQLQIVLGNWELIRELGPPDSALAPLHDGAWRALLGARDLAASMLAYSGRGTLRTGLLPLDRMARDLCEGWVRTQSGIALDYQAPPGLASARVDPVQIRQVVLNFLVNAGDAGARTITVRCGDTDLSADAVAALQFPGNLQPGRATWLEVADDGSGMAPDVLERAFDPFVSGRPGGRGLGLAAVLGIIRAHEGAIDVDTAPGRGTRMRVYLPVADNPVTRSAEPTPPGERPTAATAGPTGAATTGDLTLLIDDNAAVRATVAGMLAGQGHHLHPLDSVRAVRDWLQRPDPGRVVLALVDLSLLDGDGVEVTRLLRARYPGLPVVLVSGYDGSDALARLGNEPGVQFLQKPFGHAELMGAIDAAMHGPWTGRDADEEGAGAPADQAV